MALDMGQRGQLAEKAADAECLLVVRRFRDAEAASLDLLQSSIYLPRSQLEQQRAGCVYIQAMYEQER